MAMFIKFEKNDIMGTLIVISRFLSKWLATFDLFLFILVFVNRN